MPRRGVIRLHHNFHRALLLRILPLQSPNGQIDGVVSVSLAMSAPLSTQSHRVVHTTIGKVDLLQGVQKRRPSRLLRALQRQVLLHYFSDLPPRWKSNHCVSKSRALLNRLSPPLLLWQWIPTLVQARRMFLRFVHDQLNPSSPFHLFPMAHQMCLLVFLDLPVYLHLLAGWTLSQPQELIPRSQLTKYPSPPKLFLTT